jgi:3-hydroxybutyryl-CoA dehydrogenase
MTRPQLHTSPRVVGVVGAGTMGIGIAYVFAVAGSQVTVVEPSAAQVAVMWAAVDGALAGAVKRNKITSEDAALARARIHPVVDVHHLPEAADLVIESVPEDLALKTNVLQQIEQRQPTTLATNTSSISIDSLASSLSEPGRFLGMHFFNPVWSLPLVELITGASTEPDTLDAARSAVDALGKQSITVTDIPGFATSRLDMSAALEAMRMLEDGVASATDIDRAAVLAYRHPVGPLELSDIVGLDVRLDIARSLHASHGDRYAPPAILIAKVAAGDLGKKTGRGFHDWTSTDPAHSPTT